MKLIKYIGVGVVGLSVLFFIILQFDWITQLDERKTMEVSDFENRIEFEHEGNVWILNSSQSDTLATLPIEVADSAIEIRFGMMERKSFEPHAYGMLFIMPKKKIQSFWMLNTYVSLDIIYLDGNRIVSISDNTTPETKDLYYSSEPSDFVLEVPAGFASTHGIKSGDIVAWERIEE
ncbi:MAG: DUF192 domain-containing protein [Flavobacteriia bacterium]|nr:DUF192 domain-containing protein [Flavobacteriia bacterium]